MGIGASTAIFSLTDALLLRPRPGITDADRVVDIGRANGRGIGFDNFGYPLFQMLQARASALWSFSATRSGSAASRAERTLSVRLCH